MATESESSPRTALTRTRRSVKVIRARYHAAKCTTVCGQICYVVTRELLVTGGTRARASHSQACTGPPSIHSKKRPTGTRRAAKAGDSDANTAEETRNAGRNIRVSLPASAPGRDVEVLLGSAGRRNRRAGLQYVFLCAHVE